MRSVPLFFTALLLFAGQGFAQTLTAQLIPERVRVNAPQHITVKLNWTGTGVFEGILEVSVRDGNYQLLSYRTPEMVLGTGTREVALLLPGIPTTQGYADSADLRFISGKRVLELGRFDLGTRGLDHRPTTICVSRPRPGSATGAEFWPALRFGQAPAVEVPKSAWVSGTAPVYLEPAEFPTDPLAFCAYDVVVLDAAGFSEIKAKQLVALESWVQAGGSLCVQPGGTLNAGQREWVERLEAAAVAGSDPAALRHVFAGLGRAVLVPSEAPTPSSEQWKLASDFLWKCRLKSHGSAHGIGLRPMLVDLLMPRHVRLIPASVLLWMLGGFLLVIGPLDFWVLGKLRMRRWTWIVFPCMALAFTGLMLWLTGRHLGAKSERVSLIITDLAASGRVVRESRVELLFSPAAGEVQTEVRNALVSPVAGESDYNGVPRIEGQFPARFTLFQPLGQWTPRLNRFFPIEPGEDPSGLPWEELAGLHASPPRNAQETAAWKEKLGGHRVDVVVFDRSGKSPTIVSSAASMATRMDPTFLQRICLRADSVMASVVSQVSPNGAGDFADLPMIEAARDPATLLIVATRREGANVHVFRRLYCP